MDIRMVIPPYGYPNGQYPYLSEPVSLWITRAVWVWLSERPNSLRLSAHDG